MVSLVKPADTEITATVPECVLRKEKGREVEDSYRFCILVSD